MDYRLVASPRATALHSILTCVAACALLGACAGKGAGGTGATTGGGGTKATGGSNGAGGTPATGGATGSGGSTATGGSIGSGGGGGSGASVGTGVTPATGGSPGTGGTPATGGSPGTGGSTTISDAGADATCQTADFTFVPQIPTVYLLVSRSGSMFHCLNSTTTESWAIRSASTPRRRRRYDQHGLVRAEGSHRASVAATRFAGAVRVQHQSTERTPPAAGCVRRSRECSPTTSLRR